MDHSDNLKDVPKVDSKEFEKFLEDNGFNKKIFNNDFINKSEDFLNNSINDNPTPDQPKKESIGKIIDNWRMKNPRASLAIVLGVSAFIYYKMIIGVISEGVFKGNLKTSRYFDKHAGQ